MLAVVPVDTFGYKLLFLLHVLAVIVAFAPAFTYATSSVYLKRQGKTPGPVLGTMAAANDLRVHGPALVLTGLFGIGLILVSEDVWDFTQTWISVGLLLWFLMLGVLFGLLIPAERRAGAGDAGAEKMVSMGGGILHLLLLLQLVDMIWKPGL